MIPVGTAIIAKPIIIRIFAIIIPSDVFGTISPYPTVVMVVIAQ